MRIINFQKIAVIDGFLLFALFVFTFHLSAQQTGYETTGVKDNLPVFYRKLAERQVYPLSWLQGEKGDFSILVFHLPDLLPMRT